MNSLHKWCIAIAVFASAAALVPPRVIAKDPTEEEQAAAAEERAQRELIASISTRVYDIRDLLMQRRAYPAQSALVPPTRMGEPRATAAAIRPSSRPSTPADLEREQRNEVSEQLRSLIMETIDPDSWRDNGGSLGALRELNGQLIVSQAARNHEALAQLLKQLRETSSRMVTIKANWIFLKPGQLKLVTKPVDSDPALFVVDLPTIEKMQPMPKSFAGQVTCFNTQTVHIASGNARTVITKQTPVVGTDTVGYEPESSIVQAGMLLEVTPVLTPDASTVMLDIQSVTSDWGAFENNPGGEKTATRPVATPPDIDHVQMLVQQLRSSVALPVNKPIVVGGMTFAPGASDEGEQLYLVIEARASGATAVGTKPINGGGKPNE
jgi:hypothetical protein